MKIKKLTHFRRGAIVAMGVFLAHGAQANTVLDFASLPDGQVNNCNGSCPGILQGFGGLAASSSAGVTVTGFGTPNINVLWSGIGETDTKWDYYLNWLTDPGAAQLNDSDVGAIHDVTFVPNNPSVAVDIGSFNFFPYYQDNERFTYVVSVLAGTNVVSGPVIYTYASDAANDHPANVNYTGAPGQALKLRIQHIASNLAPDEVEGGGYNIAIDTLTFSQTPASVAPAGPQVVLYTPPDDQTNLTDTYVPPVLPADDQTVVPAILHPFQVSVTNGATTLATNSLQLKLDGVAVSPLTISQGGSLTTVSSPGTTILAFSGIHSYVLTYQDNLGSNYYYEADFDSVFSTLPSSWALPEGSGVARGFNFFTYLADQGATNTVLSDVSDATALLNGSLVNPMTGQPFPNQAILGTNANGSYTETGTINFNGDNGGDEGDFPNDQIFPGLDVSVLPLDWFATRATLYLDLSAGYYRLGVNSDDGFAVNALPPSGVSGSPLTVGIFDGGRGSSDSLFDVLVQKSGIYPFQVIYFQETGTSTEEFFASTNFNTGGGILINDPSNPSAIVAYSSVTAPVSFSITSAVLSGGNIILNWSAGNPPYQVQTKTDLSSPTWTNVGSATSNTTATIAIQPGAAFFRIVSQ